MKCFVVIAALIAVASANGLGLGHGGLALGGYGGHGGYGIHGLGLSHGYGGHGLGLSHGYGGHGAIIAAPAIAK